MGYFDDLNEEVNRGLEGKNSGISMGFNRLNKFIGIRKRIYTLVFGPTGSGKSAFVHSAYILNPYDWYISKQNTSNIKLKIILFSMERSKVYTLAKWLSRKIFIDQAVMIPIPKLLGWWELKLSKDEHDLFLMYQDYIDGLEQVVDIQEGAINPTGVYRYMYTYALANGREEAIGDHGKKIYTPNNENEVVIVIGDHFGLWKSEKGLDTKKERIDKGSEYFQWFRDYLGYFPVAVAQINRDKGNVLYQQKTSFELTIDDVKESGRMGEDCDCAISVFEPLRYNTDDEHYRAEKFINPNTGAKCFRGIKILKNTYGEDDIKVGMGFHGATGIYKELPRPADLTPNTYSSIIDGSYFIT